MWILISFGISPTTTCLRWSKDSIRSFPKNNFIPVFPYSTGFGIPRPSGCRHLHRTAFGAVQVSNLARRTESFFIATPLPFFGIPIPSSDFLLSVGTSFIFGGRIPLFPPLNGSQSIWGMHSLLDCSDRAPRHNKVASSQPDG